MKIVFVRNDLTTGGLGIMCLTQANYFYEKGFDVTILLDMPYKESLYSSAIYKKYNDGIKVIPTLTSNGYKLNDPKIPRRGERESWFGGSISSYYDEYGVLVKRAWHDSRRQRVKLYIPIMEEYLSKLNAGDIIIGMEASLSWYLGQISLPKGVRYMIQLHNQHFYLFDWIDNVIFPNRIVCLTPKMKEVYESLYGRKENISVVPNPLRLDIPSSILSHEKRPLKIVSVGRIDEGKNPLDTIKAFEKINEKLPNSYLEFYGNGKLVKTLKEYINSREAIKNKVFFKGYESNISKIFSDASLLLFTSKRESFGLVIIEAFAYGVPVVAYSTVFGVDDLIDHNIDGFITNQGNIEDIANFAIKLLSNNNLRDIFANRGWKKSKQYSYSNVMPKWFNLIKNLSYKKIDKKELRYKLINRLNLPNNINNLILSKNYSEKDFIKIIMLLKNAKVKILNGKLYIFSSSLLKEYDLNLSDFEI